MTAGELRRAAAVGEEVAVVDRRGLLVNVGTLSESNDVRKVVFSSHSSSGVADVWLDEAGEFDQFGYAIAPVTQEHRARWSLVLRCREIAWARLPDDVLRKVLGMVPDHPGDARMLDAGQGGGT